MSGFNVDKANKALIKEFIKEAKLTYYEDFLVESVWQKDLDYVVDIRPIGDSYSKDEIRIEVLDLAGFLACKIGLINIQE